MKGYHFNILGFLSYIGATHDFQTNLILSHTTLGNFITYLDSADDEFKTIDSKNFKEVNKHWLVASFFGHHKQDEIEKLIKPITFEREPGLSAISYNNVIRDIFKLRIIHSGDFTGRIFFSQHLQSEIIPLFLDKRITNFFIKYPSHYSLYNSNDGFQLISNNSDVDTVYMIANPNDYVANQNNLLINHYAPFHETLKRRKLVLTQSSSLMSIAQYIICLFSKKSEFELLDHQIDYQEIKLRFIADDIRMANKKMNELKAEFRNQFNYTNETYDEEIESIVNVFYGVTTKRSGAIFTLSLLLTYGNAQRLEHILQ